MLRGLDGNAAAQHELLSALSRYLRAYFARRLGADAAEVEDLVQETLIAVHLKRDAYDRAQPFTPWAYGVARYKLLDHFRRVGRRAEAPLEAAEALFAVEDGEARHARRDLEKLMDGLTERQRGLLQDVKITGLSIEEASRARGMTPSAVKVSIHRSLQALARKVRDADR
ncbi:MAG TPA: sigma-70 family RNA polymerase sigma factor [Caulobacteraceae bacterium]|nr:sigma-70 family RNA polymerase sigma factor [Caulobacteraceae bacterium]